MRRAHLGTKQDSRLDDWLQYAKGIQNGSSIGPYLVKLLAVMFRPQEERALATADEVVLNPHNRNQSEADLGTAGASMPLHGRVQDLPN